jgi:hypothetical protein
MNAFGDSKCFAPVAAAIDLGVILPTMTSGKGQKPLRLTRKKL